MLRIGEVVDKYRIEAMIGQGGMAAVYRARHVTLDSLHAVKILFITAPAVRDRLIREGKVQAQLRHPNIVSVTDVLEVMGAPALVMEYVDGPPLDAWLLENRPTIEEAMFLFRGILRGISAAHERGVIHRDLKPANVMLSPSSEGVIPKVTDFGLVKSLGGDQRGKTQTGMTMGTPEYMAPEQIRDSSDVDQRVDLFALGCILYELVCHRRAFAGPDNISVFNNIVHGTYPPPRKFVEDLPSNVHEAIRVLLEPDRDKRLSSCTQLIDLLYDEQAVGRLGKIRGNVSPIQIGATLGSGSYETPEPTFEIETPAPAPSATPAPVRSTSGDSLTAGLSPVQPNPMRMVIPVVAAAMIIGVLVGAAAFGLYGTLTGAPDEPPVDTLAVQPAPVPQPVVPAPATVAVPAPAIAPLAAPVAAPVPAPVAAPVPAPVAAPAPPPAPIAAPAPVAKPAPVPAPAPVAPAPAPTADVGSATVSFVGDARAVWLESGGKRVAAGPGIPPGTYKVLADFGQQELAAAGTVTIRAGQTLTLDCQSFLFQCRPK